MKPPKITHIPHGNQDTHTPRPESAHNTEHEKRTQSTAQNRATQAGHKARGQGPPLRKQRRSDPANRIG
jgi:hypothetical protein